METFQTLTRFGLDKGIFIQDLNNYLEIVQNELEVFEGDTNEYHFYNYLSPVVGDKYSTLFYIQNKHCFNRTSICCE